MLIDVVIYVSKKVYTFYKTFMNVDLKILNNLVVLFEKLRKTSLLKVLKRNIY